MGVCALLAVNLSAQDIEPILTGAHSAFKASAPSIANVAVPQGVSYQAVARNASGEILANQPVGLRVSILANSSTGDVRYVETHTATSDAFGVLSFVIGGGTPTGGTFSNINWSGETIYVKLEADFAGGTTYADLGASRVWSVPFALAAGNAFDPSIPRIINSDEGDSAIVTRLSGTRIARTYQNFVTTNSTSNGSVYNSVVPSGDAGTFNWGTYNLVTANGAAASSYAGYNVTQGTSKIKMGSIGFALGEGSGEIVPLGDPKEAQGNFGSINFGMYGVSRGNTNLNTGVFGRADGTVGGARGNVGVEGQSFTNSNTNNLGMVASAGNSSVRNIGLNSRATFNTAGDNIGGEFFVNNASGNNIGLIVGAQGTNATAIVSNGNLTVNGNITHSGTITQSSDLNLKEGIAPLSSTLSTLMNVNVYSYQYRNDTGLSLPSGTHFGVIAQEMELMFPNLVHNNRQIVSTGDAIGAGPSSETAVVEFKSVNYTEMIPVLIKAIQEQQEQIDALKAEIERLRGK